MNDYHAAAQRIVNAIGEPAARDLLRLLESDGVVRADAFRQFYERGGHESLPDSLTDLETGSGCAGGWSNTCV